MVDRNVLAEIVTQAAVAPDDVILEVGPGKGVLTKELLLAGCKRLYAVELDSRMHDFLDGLAAEYPQLTITWGDAMKIPYDLDPFPNKVVANIPYNITTPLIWKLLSFAPRGLTYHLYMVQKESADRLTAPPDTKERYPLGIALEAMGEVRLVRGVPAECFRPVPRVESAVIEIKIARNLFLMQNNIWNEMLHTGFRQRRKTLLNNLKGWGGIDDWFSVLQTAGISLKIRAEDLTCQEWMALYTAFLQTSAAGR